MVKRKVSKNFFIKFWNGDLSLPMSYWLVAVVFGIIVGLVVLMITIATGMPEVMMSILLLPWVVYVSVGCWRSSDKYRGPKFWSIIVKILVIIGIIRAVALLFTSSNY